MKGVIQLVMADEKARLSPQQLAAHDLHSVAFPTLEEDQIAQVANCTAILPKHYADGETLIKAGDRNIKFFIVKKGEIEIIDYSGDEPRTLAIHHKGGFTGDISHLTGNPAIFNAV